MAAATKSEPDRMVAMQLVVLHGGKYRPFTRVDWRGSPHTNRNYPQSPLNLKSLGETHIHRLGDNAFLGWPGIIATGEDLPVAGATPALADFSRLIAYIGEEFVIENADEMREPPWEPLLSTPIVGRAGDVAIADAIGGLVRARTTPSRIEIALPVLYPNGSHVVVFAYPEGDAFTVTDEGGAATEAEMAGVLPATFSIIARREASALSATAALSSSFVSRPIS